MVSEVVGGNKIPKKTILGDLKESSDMHKKGGDVNISVGGEAEEFIGFGYRRELGCPVGVFQTHILAKGEKK